MGRAVVHPFAARCAQHCVAGRRLDREVALQHGDGVVAVRGVGRVQNLLIGSDRFILIRAGIADFTEVVLTDQAFHLTGEFRVLLTKGLLRRFDRDGGRLRGDLEGHIVAGQVIVAVLRGLDAHSHETIGNVGHARSSGHPLAVTDLVVDREARIVDRCACGMGRAIVLPFAALCAQHCVAGCRLDREVALRHGDAVVLVRGVGRVQNLLIGSDRLHLSICTEVVDFTEVVLTDQAFHLTGECGVLLTEELLRRFDRDGNRLLGISR